MDLFQCFIDLTKAFGTVNRTMLWKVLKKFGCPDKFIQLIRSLHDDMKAMVNFNGTLSEPFPVESGVKQGDVLVSTLFTQRTLKITELCFWFPIKKNYF